jgi:hypothetical protein
MKSIEARAALKERIYFAVLRGHFAATSRASKVAQLLGKTPTFADLGEAYTPRAKSAAIGVVR